MALFGSHVVFLSGSSCSPDDKCCHVCCQARSSGVALALGDLFVALAGFISASAAEATASVTAPSHAVVHAVRLAAAAAAALPRCWATLREPDRARLAHAAGLVLAPGQRTGMAAGAGAFGCSVSA